MLSHDRRLLMCGKVVIQMNQKEDDVQDIGCFHLIQDSAYTSYKFYSLLDKVSRKLIYQIIKEGNNSFVEFNFHQEPLTTIEQPHCLYALNLLDA